TDPPKPADPVEPTDPPKPADPTEPTDPPKPADPPKAPDLYDTLNDLQLMRAELGMEGYVSLKLTTTYAYEASPEEDEGHLKMHQTLTGAAVPEDLHKIDHLL